MKEFRLIWILILPDNLLLTDYFSLKLLFIIYGGFFEYIKLIYDGWQQGLTNKNLIQLRHQKDSHGNRISLLSLSYKDSIN